MLAVIDVIGEHVTEIFRKRLSAASDVVRDLEKVYGSSSGRV